ncbi:MAG: hypothetical protein RLO06_09600 [Parvibaculum sp.]
MPASSNDPVLAAKRELIRDPRSLSGHQRLASAAGAASEFQTMGRALAAHFLIARSPLARLRPILERMLSAIPGSPVLPLLWRFAEEESDFTYESHLERRLAREADLTPAQRWNYLRYLFRRADFELPELPYVVVGMPKSASTFVSGLVAELAGVPIDTPHSPNDFLGTGFDKGRMWDLCNAHSVVHGHLAATPRTLSYFRLLNVRPIITVRNIFDALRSYADHITVTEEDGRSALWMNFAVMRMAALNVEFYATWCRAWQRGWDQLWVEYDEVRSDPHGLVDRLVMHLGAANLARDGVARAQAMLEGDRMSQERKRSLMFNKGQSGRGREIPEVQKSVVRQMYSIYPDIDFSPIDPEA